MKCREIIDYLVNALTEKENVTLETLQMQINGIKEQQISRQRVYEFLELFDIMYDEFTEAEKKEFFNNSSRELRYTLSHWKMDRY